VFFGLYECLEVVLESNLFIYRYSICRFELNPGLALNSSASQTKTELQSDHRPNHPHDEAIKVGLTLLGLDRHMCRGPRLTIDSVDWDVLQR
jgi:hypothetical protein